MNLAELCELVPGLLKRRSLNADILRSLLDRQAGTCTWCGKPVQRGRRTWCSDACVLEYNLTCSPNHQRTFVQNRDAHICQLCGWDTKQAWREYRAATRGAGYLPKSKLAELTATYRCSQIAAGEMDHIVAVADGGGLLGVSNLRWVCVTCHAERTKGQRIAKAGRRSRKRRR